MTIKLQYGELFNTYKALVDIINATPIKTIIKDTDGIHIFYRDGTEDLLIEDA